MNFTTFLVSSTNIFPLANSTAGGQLLSEWNLRSREMVSTPSAIHFDAGHSFTHCDDDYKVALDTGDTDSAVSRSTLKIFPGRAIVNGHFVENLAPMYIDILEANTELQNHSMSPLKGKLAIGIRAYYSTEATMAGSMVAEDNNNKYSGVQLVILPETELLTPMDVPEDESAVTCHLKLATFTFRNGSIVESSITQNPNKTKYIDGERIFNINDILSDTYISKAGIHPNRLYVFAGKSTYNSTTGSYDVSGKDTWCDATGSLMVWDSHTDINKNTTTDDTELGDEAVFGVDLTDNSVYLDIPHKQVDGMKNANGELLYYKDKIMKLPKADYVLNTPGTVTPEYTKNIKKINDRLSLELHNLVGGKQRAYRESISTQEINESDGLPEINPLWDVGDYVLVGQDLTVENSTTANAPSTIYAVIPGLVKNLAYVGCIEDGVESWEHGYSHPTGVKLYEASVSDDLFIPRKMADDHFQRTYVSKTPVAFISADNSPIMTVASYEDIAVSFIGTGTKKVFEDAKLAKPASSTIHDKTIDDIPTDIIIDGETNIDEVILGGVTISPYPELDADTSKIYYVFETNTSTGSIKFVNYNTDTSSWEDYAPRNGETISVIGQITHTRGLEYNAVNPVTGAVIAKSVVSALEETSMTATYNYYEMSRKYEDLFPDFMSMRGTPGVDYFVVVYQYTKTENDVESSHVKEYYFVVTSATPKEWSSTIYLTGTIPLATEETIGGFYNVASDASDRVDAGYVYMDTDGHLRLVDYGLLRTGLLAYQLGEDLTFPTSLSLSEVQDYLDEYVNDRIAFPNSEQKKNAAKNNVPANVIHIYIDIADAESPSGGEETSNQAITIRNIDSRFGTCVYFHFNGTATSKTTINVVDCQKIRIDPVICGDTVSNAYEGGPIINLYRTNLYYDAAVLNYIVSADRNTQANGLNDEIEYEDGVVYADFYPENFTGIVGLSLWYQPYESGDPQIVVDDKTVSELDVGYISEGFEFWNLDAPNDTHYKMALSSISFDGTGVITKVGLLIADSSTNNIDPDGQHVFYGKFTLPQGAGLSYPQACIKKPLKITGNFVSAYKPDGGTEVIISNTNFTAETGTYDVANSNRTATGNIAIMTNITAASINADVDTVLAPWKQNTYNLFYGGTVC